MLGLFFALILKSQFGQACHEIQKLFASAENFGITDLEFSWERKLTRVLEKLLPE